MTKTSEGHVLLCTTSAIVYIFCLGMIDWKQRLRNHLYCLCPWVCETFELNPSIQSVVGAARQWLLRLAGFDFLLVFDRVRLLGDDSW